MFIEYEIKEEEEILSAIINVDNLCLIDRQNNILEMYCTHETFRFYESVDILYDAFRRALCGESITLEGKGFIRPLQSTKNPMWPITSINWREVS